MKLGKNHLIRIREEIRKNGSAYITLPCGCSTKQTLEDIKLKYSIKTHWSHISAEEFIETDVYLKLSLGGKEVNCGSC